VSDQLKISRRQWAVQGRRQLVAAFPLAFMAKGAVKRPLKIGIHEDILRLLPEMEPAHLAAALGDYTGGPTYHRSMIPGAARVDLAGKPAGSVTPEAAAHAVRRLASILKKPIHEVAAQAAE
jgi:ProP effector